MGRQKGSKNKPKTIPVDEKSYSPHLRLLKQVPGVNNDLSNLAKRNIYAQKFPHAKTFVGAIMEEYKINLRDVAKMAMDKRYRFDDKAFEGFITLLEPDIDTGDYLLTYDMKFARCRRRLLQHLSRIQTVQKCKKMDEEFNEEYGEPELDIL